MTEQPSELIRCSWDPWPSDLMLRYHDEEWGMPSHDDRHLFEMLILEGAQAGLSWNTILNKRENYRRAFDAFDFGGVRVVRRLYLAFRRRLPEAERLPLPA